MSTPMSTTGHHHGSQPPGTGTPGQRRALRFALWLNGGYLIAEVAGGVVFSSLALLADAGHMLTDVGALGLALLAFRLARRPASDRHSYGLQRAELLAALANVVTLGLVAGLVAVEAVRRLGEPPEVQGVGLLVVAAIGLVVNVVSAAAIARSRAGNLNMEGAYLHLLADALGSVAAIAAGVAVVAFDAAWVDPAMSLLIVVLIAVSSWRLLRDVVHVLLEGTPRDVDPAEIAGVLHAEPAVDRVHHVHVWQLSSGSRAMSAHIVAERVHSLHEAQLVGDRLKMLLAERFTIDHATLELECHDCREQQIVPFGEFGSGT